MTTEHAKENPEELKPLEGSPEPADAQLEECEPAEALEPLALYETGTFIPAVIGITAAAVLTLAAFREYGSGRQILAAVLGVYLLYLFISMVLRRKKPFVVITTEGLMFVGGKAKLLWKQIVAWETVENTLLKIHTGTTITLFLKQSEVDPKKFNIFGDRRVLFIRKRCVVEMRVVELAGMTGPQVLKALDTYRDACPDLEEEIQRGPRAKKRKTARAAGA